MDQRHDWAPVSAIAVMAVCGAATSEGLIVRSIHRHCQFHLRVIQETGSAPLPLSEDVVGLNGQDVSGGKHVLSMVSTTATMSAASATRG